MTTRVPQKITTVHVGDHQFNIHVLATPGETDVYTLAVDYDRSYELYGSRLTTTSVARIGNLSGAQCTRMVANIRPTLDAYLKSIGATIGREFADETKQFIGMNSSIPCQCCGRQPETIMHFTSCEKDNISIRSNGF